MDRRKKEFDYLAIRKPEELRGIYSIKEEIKSLKNKMKIIDGASYKGFNEEDKAIKWVEEDVEPSKEYVNPYERFINDYIQDGNEIIVITLHSGKVIELLVKDIYFFNNRGWSFDSFYKNNLSDGKDRYSIDISEFTLNEEKLKNNLSEIKHFNKSHIEYFKDGIKISGYNLPSIGAYDDFNSVKTDFKNNDIFIINTAISSIETLYRWESLYKQFTNRIFNHKEVIKAYNKLIKEI